MDNIELDAIDLKLLQLLQRDASLSNQALASLVHVSAPTCLRRVSRMRAAGVIERVIALINPTRLNPNWGHGLIAIVEITLDRQDAAELQDFERRACEASAVQQCYRVSSGPDFVLIIGTPDMPAYLHLTQQLFTSNANVRNVKTFFSIKRSKFETRLELPSAP